MFRLICLCIGYCIGCIETAYVVGRIWQVDLRQHGSGNLGTTNALRVLGKKAGALVFIGDIMKSVIAFVICRAIFGSNLAGVYGSVGAVLGHNYPFYLKFKGGKGILVGATMIAVFDWRVFCVAIAAFIVLVAITKWVSLGSIVGSCLVPVMTLYFHWGEDMLLPMMIILVAMVTAVVYMHRSNIVRIAHGEENKFSLHSKKEH